MLFTHTPFKLDYNNLTSASTAFPTFNFQESLCGRRLSRPSPSTIVATEFFVFLPKIPGKNVSVYNQQMMEEWLGLTAKGRVDVRSTFVILECVDIFCFVVVFVVWGLFFALNNIFPRVRSLCFLTTAITGDCGARRFPDESRAWFCDDSAVV